MVDVHPEFPGEDASRNVARVVWGLLMIWIGAVLLFRWGWGIGSIGAGLILLGAQAVRRYRRLKVDGFGLIAGAALVISGSGSLFQVAVDLFPVLCILVGAALLVSTRVRRTRHASRERTDLQAPSQPRA